MMAKKPVLRIGTKVRLKRKFRCRQLPSDNKTAKIISYIGDIPGRVRLDRTLDAFTYWNIDDLERAPERMRR